MKRRQDSRSHREPESDRSRDRCDDRLGLPDDDFRVQTLSWALLALDNEKQRLLHGERADVDQWQRVTDALAAILPQKPKVLEVAFIDKVICRKCEVEVSPEEADALKAEQAAPPKIETPAPQPMAAPPALAPAPAVKVVPLHQPQPVQSIHSLPGAPLQVGADAPWRTEGSVGFRRFDISENF